jgi:DNA-binding transcriptional MerR regulator
MKTLMLENNPEIQEIPDKLYFKIGEVSRIVNVPSYVLRFWETEFRQIKPKRTDSGQRLYRKRDVHLVLHIKQLLYDQKFTIDGARQHLKKLRKATKQTSGPLTDTAEIKAELIKIRDFIDTHLR